MNRRNFLTFLGIGAIGAATCIEAEPFLEPQDAIARPKDMDAVRGILKGMPYDTKMVFHNVDVPHGWVKDTTLDNQAVRAVSGPVGKEVW